MTEPRMIDIKENVRGRLRVSRLAGAFTGMRTGHVKMLAFASLLLLGMSIESTGKVETRSVSSGGKGMHRDQFIARLRQVDPENERQIASLAQEVAKEAREPVQAAVSIWKGSDPKMAHKALLFLSEMEDLGIIPLVDAPSPPKPQEKVWLMQTAVASEIALRERVAARLTRFLDDKTAVPIAVPPQHVESRVLPRRVCDESYMELRRLLNSSESQQQYFTNVRIFLSLSDAEKDKAIAAVRHAPQEWKRFDPGP